MTDTMKSRIMTSRESNMELLRIVAMAMVLLLHFNLSVKQPSYSSFGDLTGIRLFHLGLQSICIIAVNVFVIISGWFSIKFSLKSIAKFLFTCCWFACTGIVVTCILSGELSRVGPMLKSILWLDGGYWFVRAYLVVFIISPVLNTYISNTSIYQQRNTIILFYVVQTFFGWFLGKDFVGGYSTISFIGLYLFGRYLHELDSLKMIKAKYFWGVFAVSILLNMLYAILFFAGHNVTLGSPFDYNNPLIVISAASLVVAFSKLRIQSNIINWIAASSFAIYLFHTHGMFFGSYYLTHLHDIYYLNDGVVCLGMVICYLLGIAALAILLDQPRKLLWNWISKGFANKEVSLQKD